MFPFLSYDAISPDTSFRIFWKAIYTEQMMLYFSRRHHRRLNTFWQLTIYMKKCNVFFNIPSFGKNSC